MRQLTALAFVTIALPAAAGEFQLSADSLNLTGTLSGTVSLGTMIRADNPGPDSYPYITSQILGLPAGNALGTSGSADTNFKKNKPVSTVLKALVDLDIHGRDLGIFVRGSAWRDLELGRGGVLYGNFPNGYQAGAPLSDRGFAPEARFDNVMLRDTYAYGGFAVAPGVIASVRVGRQTMDWGQSLLTGGGINAAINPIDFAANYRPGVLPEESKLPTGMLSFSLTADKTWGADAFLKYEFRGPVLTGCGTFFDAASLFPAGCNLAGAIGNTNATLATVASLSEPSILQSGYYVHRAPDANPSTSGQWGVSLRYKAAVMSLELKGYLLNTHSVAPALRVYKEAVGGLNPLTRLSDPNGLRYALTFAENVHLVGMGFDARPNHLSRIYGELALRSNAAVNWNGNDLLTAALSPGVSNTLLNLARNTNAVPLGGSFDAFDRYKVTTASVGGNRVLPDALGAQRVALSAELGFNHVSGLPDPNVMRFGRAFAYGAAPYQGSTTACSEAIQASGIPAGFAGKTCTTEGYVSSNAWGFRLNLSAHYAEAILGATLIPSLYLAQDVSGYSYDGSYSKGRITLRPGLRAEWGRSYYVDFQYSRYAGGNYNLLADRSNVSLVCAMRF